VFDVVDDATPATTPRIAIGTWVLRGCIAAGFLLLGERKLFPVEGSMWVRMFDQIGYGDWFRHLTGAMQVAGALLLVVPRTAIVGAALIGATLVGAMLAHMFVLGTGVGGAIIPGFLLVPLAAAVWKRLST
jgi:putative oxidoreductase